MLKSMQNFSRLGLVIRNSFIRVLHCRPKFISCTSICVYIGLLELYKPEQYHYDGWLIYYAINSFINLFIRIDLKGYPI